MLLAVSETPYVDGQLKLNWQTQTSYLKLRLHSCKWNR